MSFSNILLSLLSNILGEVSNTTDHQDPLKIYFLTWWFLIVQKTFYDFDSTYFLNSITCATLDILHFVTIHLMWVVVIIMAKAARVELRTALCLWNCFVEFEWMNKLEHIFYNIHFLNFNLSAGGWNLSFSDGLERYYFILIFLWLENQTNSIIGCASHYLSQNVNKWLIIVFVWCSYWSKVLFRYFNATKEEWFS